MLLLQDQRQPDYDEIILSPSARKVAFIELSNAGVRKFLKSGMNMKGKIHIDPLKASGSRQHFSPAMFFLWLRTRRKKNCLSQKDGEIKEIPDHRNRSLRGPEDLACHASKGRTPRTEVMFSQRREDIVYLCTMYWMLNFVAGGENDPRLH